MRRRQRRIYVGGVRRFRLLLFAMDIVARAVNEEAGDSWQELGDKGLSSGEEKSANMMIPPSAGSGGLFEPGPNAHEGAEMERKKSDNLILNSSSFSCLGSTAPRLSYTPVLSVKIFDAVFDSRFIPEGHLETGGASKDSLRCS